MKTPFLQIDLKIIENNARILRERFLANKIQVMGITKVMLGEPKIAKILVTAGITALGDSRIKNIKRMRNSGIIAEFILIRAPFHSCIDEVVQYADISFNTELSTLKKLSYSSVIQNKIHKVILMIEMGDRREGILEIELEEVIRQTLSLKNIQLIGLGTNLTCISGVKPTPKKMKDFSNLVHRMETKFNMKFQTVSGGNSSCFEWISKTTDVGNVNNIRLGEAIFLGCETLIREPISGLSQDAIHLTVEVIESKIKPSAPDGEICQDAFGKIPSFQDKGDRLRSILGIGKQDVSIEGLIPPEHIKIIAASSDHLVVDATPMNLKVGDKVTFQLNYSALLSAMTSPFISKEYIS